MRLRISLAPILVLLLLANLTLPADEVMGPPLWEVEGNSGKALLVGTIHLMQPGIGWFGSLLRERIANADALVLEVVPGALGKEEQRRLVQELAFLPEGEQLSSLIDRETFNNLSDTLAGVGVPTAAIERWKPWFAAITVTSAAAQRAGFSAEHGVEARLAAFAESEGVPIAGLENAEEQLRIFSSLSRKAEIYFLEESLEEEAQIAEEFERLKDAWLEEELGKLEEMLLEAAQENPKFHHAIYTRRNRRWADEIARLLNAGGDFVVAVGTGHLVGEQSVQRILESRGFKVGER